MNKHCVIKYAWAARRLWARGFIQSNWICFKNQRASRIPWHSFASGWKQWKINTGQHLLPFLYYSSTLSNRSVSMRYSQKQTQQSKHSGMAGLYERNGKGGRNKNLMFNSWKQLNSGSVWLEVMGDGGREEGRGREEEERMRGWALRRLQQKKPFWPSCLGCATPVLPKEKKQAPSWVL